MGLYAEFNFGNTATGGGLALTSDGASLFVADHDSHSIRKVLTADGTTTTLAGGSRGYADGSGPGAQLARPCGLAVSQDDRYLFVGDDHNDMIRMIEISIGYVTTLAGSGTSGNADGTGGAATFQRPTGVAVSYTENVIYTAGADSDRIRRVRATRHARARAQRRTGAPAHRHLLPITL